MKCDDIIAAMEIFKKYGEDFYLGAGYDLITFGPDYLDVEDEDIEALEKLGWHKCSYGQFETYT